VSGFTWCLAWALSRVADVTAPRIRRWRKNHFHDLRHSGNTLAGEVGARLRGLMDRMGHSSTRAALIYQHRTSLRDKMIADEISRRAEAERSQSGMQRATVSSVAWPFVAGLGGTLLALTAAAPAALATIPDPGGGPLPDHSPQSLPSSPAACPAGRSP
jgi:hypothetical protein